MIKVDESIIGKEACVLKLSIMTSEIVCKKAVITAFMAEKSENGISAKVRFHDGRWESAKHVFFPEHEAEEREKFGVKYGRK